MKKWQIAKMSLFLESGKDNIILSPSDYSEHKGYTHDFRQDHLENDMHTAILNCNKL